MLASMRILKLRRKERFPYSRSTVHRDNWKKQREGRKFAQLLSTTDALDDEEWEKLEDEIWEVVESGEYADWAGEDSILMPVDKTKEGQYYMLLAILSEIWDEEGAATVRNYLGEIRNQIHVRDHDNPSDKRTLGDSLKSRHEIRVKGRWGTDAWRSKSGYFRDNIRLNSATEQSVPISMSDKNKEDWKDLHSFCVDRLNKNNIEVKLADSTLGPGKVVSITSYLDVSETMTDGVANAVIKLLKTGNDFGKVKMDKYGSSVGSDKRISYEIEREEEFPNAPNEYENRWVNPPTEKDKKKYGWRKTLESTKPGITDTKDWTFVSYNLEQNHNADFDKTSYPGITSKRRVIFNLVVGFYGKKPVMIAGLEITWNLGSEKQQAKVNPLVDESVLNWRKW